MVIFPFSARKKTRIQHFLKTAENPKKSYVRNLSKKKENPFKALFKHSCSKIFIELKVIAFLIFTHFLHFFKKVLFETCKEDNIWFGYTDNYVRVKTSGKNIQKNFIAPVKICAVESMPAEAVLV